MSGAFQHITIGPHLLQRLPPGQLHGRRQSRVARWPHARMSQQDRPPGPRQSNQAIEIRQKVPRQHRRTTAVKAQVQQQRQQFLI